MDKEPVTETYYVSEFSYFKHKQCIMYKENTHDLT